MSAATTEQVEQLAADLEKTKRALARLASIFAATMLFDPTPVRRDLARMLAELRPEPPPEEQTGMFLFDSTDHV